MSTEVTLTIDGRQVTATEGEKLLFVALRNNIYIPHLCAIAEEERPSACCRLCFVEVEGKSRPVTACTQKVSNNMKVQTRTPKVDRLVKTAFELLLSDHRLQCCNCPANGSCQLQKMARERGLKLKVSRFKQLAKDTPIDDSPQTYFFDASRCVLCGQCVYADHKLAKVGAINFVCRGLKRKIGTFNNVCLSDSPCIECGLCVEACPVGALNFKQTK